MKTGKKQSLSKKKKSGQWKKKHVPGNKFQFFLGFVLRGFKSSFLLFTPVFMVEINVSSTLNNAFFFYLGFFLTNIHGSHGSR